MKTWNEIRLSISPGGKWEGEAMEVYRFQQWYIPERMMGGITRYLEHGIPPGDFLTAVICNDLAEAVGRADEENMANLPAYVSYFYNEVNAEAWGSPEKMRAYLKATREAV